MGEGKEEKERRKDWGKERLGREEWRGKKEKGEAAKNTMESDSIVAANVREMSNVARRTV